MSKAKVTILYIVLYLLQSVECHEFIFQSIDNHEDRITALESTRNTCKDCCDCRGIQIKYDGLKMEMSQMINMVKELQLEMKRLREFKMSGTQTQTLSSTSSSSSTSNFPRLSTSQTMPTTRKVPWIPGTLTNDTSKTATTIRTTDITTSSQPTTKSPITTSSLARMSSDTSGRLPSSMKSSTAQSTTNYIPITVSTTLPATTFYSTTSQYSSPFSTSTSPTSTKSDTAVVSTSPAPYNNCVDVLSNGHVRNGIYTLTLQNGKQLKAFCDLEQDGGGWLVIQRRMDGTQDFNQNWREYKHGFGNPSHEFWIGNENLHTLTTGKSTVLHITLQTWDGINHTAVYRGFHVGTEQTKYKLNVQQFISGDAEDSFNYQSSYMLRHNNMAFSTPDSDNDRDFQHCGRLLQSGWWFNMCYSSNLNGRYLKNGPYGHRRQGESFGQPTMEGTGIEWYPLTQKQYSMKFVEMKIRAK